MQRIGVIGQSGIAPHEAPLLGRFFAKLVVDVLPAALVSLIGGFLFTQYQFAHNSAAQRAAAQAAPASAEMMRLVRDEHAMIIDYLKAQAAAEKRRYAAEDDAEAQATADAKAAATTTARTAVVALAPAPVGARNKAPAHTGAAVAAPRAAGAPGATGAPLVIAQAERGDGAGPVAAAVKSNSLLAKTIDIKDYVVDATLHAVTAIGGIPNWIASMGGLIGGGAAASPDARQFNASS